MDWIFIRPVGRLWLAGVSLSLSLSLVRAFVPSRITLTLLLSYNSHSLSLTHSLTHSLATYVYVLYIYYIYTLHRPNSHLESKELKMLRVAVSSFYDYVTLVIKCMQEFDTETTMRPLREEEE